MNLELRIRMAAESILENEALREGFENDAAEFILDWGIACAKHIASATASIEDDTEAEDEAYPRMKALRKLIEATKTMTHSTDIASRIETVQLLTQHAATVYGDAYTAPEPGAMGSLVANPGSTQLEIIQNIRNLFEKPSEGAQNA